MAHDHRMNSVGEPHLNAVRRQPQGRSDLSRLRANLAAQMHSQMDGESVFTPANADFFDKTINARLQNYRLDRNAARADGKPLSWHNEETAREVNERFKQRSDFWDY